MANSDTMSRTRRYEEKRNLGSSPEPSGQSAGGGSVGDHPRFVVQHHEASTTHFDFRLEIEGVLASWAVPKGPSLDPRQKRLAVQVEDHPLAYAEFEGVIPDDEYGGGVVLVWDSGAYENIRTNDDGDVIPMQRCLEDGRIEVNLHGEKLTGGFALVQAKLGGKAKNWLLIKMRDEEADARRNPTKTEPKSVLSGRTMNEIRAEAET